MKGEIFDTQTGGIQVIFTGKERLTTGAPVSGHKRRSAERQPKTDVSNPLRLQLQENGVNFNPFLKSVSIEYFINRIFQFS